MTREETHRRRQSVATIHDIVSAMRSIAAGRIQGAQRALAVARRYQEVVLRAIAALPPEAIALPPLSAESCSTLLVMTSEQPLCGSFNQDVLALAEARWHELRDTGRVQLVVVGQRGLRQLASREIVADASESAVTSLQGLRDLVKRLSRMVGSMHVAGTLGTLRVIYNRYQSITEQIPTEEVILPPDLKRMRESVSPITGRFHRYLEPSVLLANLISEFAFIDLYRIAADSFASEQASRLVAMDGASRNTERLLTELTDLEQRERQEAVTREILELISARFAGE